MKTKKGDMRIVANLSDDLTFVSNFQDAAAVKDHVGFEAEGYDSFFVSIENGEYTEVWGIVGIIPYLSKLTTRLV